MLDCDEDWRDSDCGRPLVRPRPRHSRIWNRLFGRSRNRREDVRRLEAPRQLFHVDELQDEPRMRGTRTTAGRRNNVEWRTQSIRRAVGLLTAALIASCGPHHPSSAQERFEHAHELFLHGEVKESDREAQQGFRDYLTSSPEWAWQFKILQAKTALWRGLYSEVVDILQTVPASSDHPEWAISKMTFTGVAKIR